MTGRQRTLAADKIHGMRDGSDRAHDVTSNGSADSNTQAGQKAP
jgi:hypothetical protein